MDAALCDFLRCLHCPVCNRPPSTPYTLIECSHTFCYSCIMKVVPGGVGRSSNQLSCPTCGTAVLIKNMRRNPSYSTMIACARKMLQQFRQQQQSGTLLPRINLPAPPNQTTPTTALKGLNLQSDSLATTITPPPALDLKRRPSRNPRQQRQSLGQTEETPPKKRKQSPRSVRTGEECQSAVSSQASISLPSPKSSSASFTILATGLSAEQKGILVDSHKQVPGAIKIHLVTEYSPQQVTHIVSGTNAEGLAPRMLKYLRGILDGKPILRFDWYWALVEGRNPIEEDYLVIGDVSNNCSTGAVKASLEAHRRTDFVNLFHGMKFYFSGTFSSPSKSDLTSLILAGDGKVLSRKPAPSDQQAWIILGTEHPTSAQLRTWEAYESRCRSYGWLLDCISRYRITDE